MEIIALPIFRELMTISRLMMISLPSINNSVNHQRLKRTSRIRTRILRKLLNSLRSSSFQVSISARIGPDNRAIDSGPDGINCLPELELSQLLHGSFLRTVDSLERIFPKPWTGPKLVLAIDEAHPLSAPQLDYRPADVLCRVVKEYSHIRPKDHQ